MGRTCRPAAAAGCLFALGFALARPLPAQEPEAAPDRGSLFERLNLDRLRLTRFGGAVGGVKPSQIEPTQLFELNADYGEVAPGWRLTFTTTFWSSRFTARTVQKFTDALRGSINDPTNDYTIDAGRITVSDIAFGTDLRWFPKPRATLRPYAGAGLGAHVINAEGKIISGTFVERALDNITAGVAGMAGVDLVVLDHLSLGAQARFDLLSGARFATLRLGGSYIFDRSQPRPRTP